MVDIVVLLELADEKHAGRIGLHLLEGKVGASEGFLYAALAIDCLLDAEPVSDLAENDIPEEGVGREVLSVVSAEKDLSRRGYDVVVLSPDDVLEKDGPRALVALYVGVEGEIEGDDLHTRISLSGIVEGVAGEDIGTCSGLESLVGRVAGKIVLEFRNTGDELGKLIGPGLILKKDVSLVRALESEKLIIDSLVGTDHEIHLAVIHIEPCDAALIVFVGAESLGLGEKVFLHAGLDGDIACSLEVVADLFDMLLVLVVEPHSLQRAVLSPADQSVGALLVGIAEFDELLDRHVCGIEAGTGKTVGITLDERCAVFPVPGAVVDFGIGLLDRILDGVQKCGFVAEVLLPVDGIHLIGGETIEVENLLAVVGNIAQIRRGDGHYRIICYLLGEGRLGRLIAGGRKSQHSRCCEEKSFHIAITLSLS